MPRIQPLETEAAEGRARTLLEGVQRGLGVTPNLLRTLAHSPAALEAYLGFGRALDGGTLGRPLREQLALTIAAANGCAYCAAAHNARGQSLGLDETERAANLNARSEDPKIEAALQFAQRIVEERGWVNDEDVERIRNAGYGDGAIAEIVATVAGNIFSNYFNHIAQTDVDFPAVELPVTTAAPAAAS